jgi:RNA polymerase sigma-70 factor (ECF subfamily)
MSELEVQAWVEAARKGDQDAFAQIVQHYQYALFNTARAIMRNPEDAEDVVQEAFLKAYHNLHAIRDPSKLKLWLRQIVVRACIDKLRHQKNLKRESELNDQIKVHSVPGRTPEQEALVQEDMHLVQQALAQMNPRYRSHIVLREIDGLSYDEIAESLGESFSTVRVTLFRAREQLRIILRKLSGEEFDESTKSEQAGKARVA